MDNNEDRIADATAALDRQHTHPSGRSVRNITNIKLSDVVAPRDISPSAMAAVGMTRTEQNINEVKPLGYKDWKYEEETQVEIIIEHYADKKSGKFPMGIVIEHDDDGCEHSARYLVRYIRDKRYNVASFSNEHLKLVEKADPKLEERLAKAKVVAEERAYQEAQRGQFRLR